jgi:hypothetical protein
VPLPLFWTVFVVDPWCGFFFFFVTAAMRTGSAVPLARSRLEAEIWVRGSGPGLATLADAIAELMVKMIETDSAKIRGFTFMMFPRCSSGARRAPAGLGSSDEDKRGEMILGARAVSLQAGGGVPKVSKFCAVSGIFSMSAAGSVQSGSCTNWWDAGGWHKSCHETSRDEHRRWS